MPDNLPPLAASWGAPLVDLVPDLLKASAFRDTLRPDGYLGAAHYWHGWAIVEAYLAGLRAGRQEVKR